jgi:hypothetical protein
MRFTAIIIVGHWSLWASAMKLRSLAAWFEEREKRGERGECGDL